MKWNHKMQILIGFLLIPLFLRLFFLVEAQRNFVYTVDSFYLREFNVGQSIAFQTQYTLKLEVTEGILNGTSGNLRMWEREGELKFNAVNDSQIYLSSPDVEYGFDLSINGATGGFSNLGNFTWSANILTGDNIVILWSWRIESWVDQYTVLGIGLGGLILMVASPTWVALKIKKTGITADSIERIGYAILLFLIGFGLLIIWLWS